MTTPASTPTRTLTLEYAITPDEREEAHSLALRQQLGGGSKWRTWVVLLAILALVLAMAWVEVGRNIPAPYWPYIAVGFVALWAFLFFRGRRDIRRTMPAITIELSSHGLHFPDPSAPATIAWSSLSRRIESDTLLLFQDRTRTLSYIIPKRVIPSPEWLDYLRHVGLNTAAAEPIPAGTGPAAVTTPAAASELVLHVLLGFRDCLDLVWASWFYRAIILLLPAFIVGYVAVDAIREPAAPNGSDRWLLVPFSLVLLAMMVCAGLLAVTLHNWLALRRHFVPTTATLTDAGIRLASRDSDQTLPWSSFARYKETRRSFILWRPGTRLWAQLPKRSLTTPDALPRCRQLLSAHLTYSTWFFRG